MKRLLCALLFAGLVLGVMNISFAEDEDMPMNKGMGQGMTGQEGKGMMGQGMKERGMMGQGMMGQGMGQGMGEMGGSMMCPLCSSMMKSAGSPQLISTGDGGFVVLAGNKLTKYDKDLNVVKEAEIKIDVQGMMDKMKDCPVCKMMKEKKEGMKEKMQERKEMKMEGKE